MNPVGNPREGIRVTGDPEMVGRRGSQENLAVRRREVLRILGPGRRFLPLILSGPATEVARPAVEAREEAVEDTL